MKLKRIVSVAISAVMCFTICSSNASADNEMSVWTEDISENNQQLIKNAIEEEDFWQLINTYVNDTECYSCSKDDLLNAKLSQLFQIPQVLEDGTVVYNDDIWHSFLVNGDTAFAVVNFVVKNSTVFYTISEAYTQEFNSAKSNNLQMYFYNDTFFCNNIQ